MISPKPIAAVALLVLSACGTPQENCISRNTRDLRVVNGLIAEVQGNLARGYGYEEVTIYTPRWQDCEDQPVGTKAPKLCLDDVAETVTKPVALDLTAEAAKLKGLEAKREALEKAAAATVAQCKAEFPE